MQISAPSIRPLAQLPVEQQPLGERNGHVPASSGRVAQSNLTLRAVVDAREAEAMLFHTRSRQTSLDAQNGLDSRSQRALNAYASLEQSAEREYVSSVLGIDEYV